MTKRDKVTKILNEYFKLNSITLPEESVMMLADHIVNSIRYKTRSDKQNSYYWAVIIGMTADYFGYDPEEMHEAWRYMFLRKGEVTGPPAARRTSDLNFTTEDAEEYYEKIRRYMLTEHNFDIPLPNEV